MRLKKLFIINNGEAAGWSDSTRTEFTVEINDYYIIVNWKGGRDMFAGEVNTAIARLLQESDRLYGVTEKYQRKSKFRFCYRTGSSGCQDTFIEYIKDDDEYPERKFMFHESCFGKTAGFKVFKYDFLDLAVVSGFLHLDTLADGRKYYAYDPMQDNLKDLEMLMIDPRDITSEEGWINDIEEEASVVYLSTERVHPTPEEIEVNE